MTGFSRASQNEVAAHIGNIVRSEVNKNADYNLEEWIQTKVRLSKGEAVLDVGCGNGKQLAVFSDVVGDSGKVIGVDIFSQVPGLLDNAREKLFGLKRISTCWIIVQVYRFLRVIKRLMPLRVVIQFIMSKIFIKLFKSLSGS